MVVPVDIGLLVIRGSTDLVKQKLQRLLELAASKVKQKLYVHLEENDNFKELLPEIYLSAASLKSGIDFRVLLDRRTVNVDKVFYDEIKDPDHPTFPIFNEDSCINKKPFSLNKTSAFSNSLEKPYDHVIMGGAFDRLHNGHKLLLSEAVLLSKKITCGVTNGEMIKKKILYELMEPVTTRCAEVENFVNDVSENVKCITVPIFDAFGPSIEDKGYEAIIVSEETLVGGEAVNIKRKERGLFPLKIHIIKLLGNERLNDRILNETKLSSSANRRELLGKILIEPTPPIEPISTKHYLIGLTGGIASGKTHIAKYLASQGCEVIECDTLVHKLYSESEELRNKLADVFGSSILTDKRNIDRKKLGEVVFGDKQKLQLLNNLVWPITFERVKEIVKKSEKEIVIIDAALLLEAGWAKYLNQVWCTFVPRQEAIERICARDGVSKENAIERLDNQLENSERIAKSNVVFCSLWEYAETERQVSKTLELIRNYYLPKTIY